MPQCATYNCGDSKGDGSGRVWDTYAERDADLQTLVWAENDRMETPAATHGVIAHRSDARAGQTSPSGWTEGKLNLVPTGLGMLPASGYLDDLRSLYCPTGKVLDAEIGRTATIGKVWTNVGHIKDLGGNSGKHLTHGDLTWVDDRNQMAYFATTTHKYSGSDMYSLRAPERSIPDYFPNLTNPPPFPKYVKYEHMAPERKTAKLLGDRSIVVDRFCKRTMTDPDRMTYPGDGLFLHKDGYNVLHGDGHCRWQGDPQQRMIWTPVPAANITVPISGSQTGWGTDTIAFSWPSGGSYNSYSYGIGYFNFFDDEPMEYNDQITAP